MERFTLALPSKGAIADPTQNFLKDCGLKVNKPNPRQYTGSMPAIPQLDVLFQRVKDVVYKVADGTAQLGITGYDVVMENPDDNLIVIHDQLGYGHCSLVVAVPQTWVDVEIMADLVDVAMDFREQKGRNLRIATTYTHMTRHFMHTNGIHHFTIAKAEGAIEAAPTIGYADIVVDLTQTGTTLRENHLRPIRDGIIVESQACLIGNKPMLKAYPQLLEIVRVMLEHIDAAHNGKAHSQLTVNIRGNNAEEVAERVAANSITSGLLGPTIAPIYSANGNRQDKQWFTVTIIIKTKQMLNAVEYLRSIGGSQIIVQPVDYIFHEESPTFNRLLEALK
ncbi:MAG: ATP phosphoribosyltransferase [Phototrophicales bacterium]|nr:MAG: ATP phosphoribosyltransferase [Phototrophicales bacterium]RMG76164.1 MAG: ATP phosphoribosyltransferase [Chloroflexota bacterium]